MCFANVAQTTHCGPLLLYEEGGKSSWMQIWRFWTQDSDFKGLDGVEYRAKRH